MIIQTYHNSRTFTLLLLASVFDFSARVDYAPNDGRVSGFMDGNQRQGGAYKEKLLDAPRKNYYAIIPADVRYDKRLRPNAKLLYGEITALTNEKGYCWAGNDYFSKLYAVKKETISRWIAQLKKYGYISIEMHYKEGTKEIEHRYISIKNEIGIDKKINTPCLNNQEGIDKKVKTPIDKKVKENTTDVNNTINNSKDAESKDSEKKFKQKVRKYFEDNDPDYYHNVKHAQAIKKLSSWAKFDFKKLKWLFDKHLEIKKEDVSKYWLNSPHTPANISSRLDAILGYTTRAEFNEQRLKAIGE